MQMPVARGSSLLTERQVVQDQSFVHCVQEHKALNQVLKLKVTEQNVAVQWLALLFRIREVWGSNIGSESGCPD
jgi:hypothetical protein